MKRAAIIWLDAAFQQLCYWFSVPVHLSDSINDWSCVTVGETSNFCYVSGFWLFAQLSDWSTAPCQRFILYLPSLT